MSLFFLLNPKFYSTLEISVIDGKKRRRRKKKKNEYELELENDLEALLLKRGVGELRIIPKDEFKYSVRDTIRKELQLTEDEEEFLIMLLMEDYDD